VNRRGVRNRAPREYRGSAVGLSVRGGETRSGPCAASRRTPTPEGGALYASRDDSLAFSFFLPPFTPSTYVGFVSFGCVRHRARVPVRPETDRVRVRPAWV
jgi:hypothetical protein